MHLKQHPEWFDRLHYTVSAKIICDCKYFCVYHFHGERGNVYMNYFNNKKNDSNIKFKKNEDCDPDQPEHFLCDFMLVCLSLCSMTKLVTACILPLGQV